VGEVRRKNGLVVTLPRLPPFPLLHFSFLHFSFIPPACPPTHQLRSVRASAQEKRRLHINGTSRYEDRNYRQNVHKRYAQILDLPRNVSSIPDALHWLQLPAEFIAGIPTMRGP